MIIKSEAMTSILPATYFILNKKGKCHLFFCSIAVSIATSHLGYIILVCGACAQALQSWVQVSRTTHLH